MLPNMPTIHHLHICSPSLHRRDHKAIVLKSVTLLLPYPYITYWPFAEVVVLLGLWLFQKCAHNPAEVDSCINAYDTRTTLAEHETLNKCVHVCKKPIRGSIETSQRLADSDDGCELEAVSSARRRLCSLANV